MIKSKTISKFIGELDSLTSPFYRGIFSIDNFSSVSSLLDLNSNNILVINSRNFADYRPGHWLLIIINTQANSFFIDTDANTPSYYSNELNDFLEYFSPNYFSLTKPVQPPKSTFCGGYIIYFCHRLIRGDSLDEITAPLHKSLPDNDSIIAAYLRSIFGKTSLKELVSAGGIIGRFDTT